MKFTNILKTLIVESGKFQFLLDKYTKPTTDKEGNKKKPAISKEVFFELVKADPKSRLNNVDLETATVKDIENVHAGGYTEWLIRRYLSPVTESEPGDSAYDREVKQMKERFLEDLYKVTDYLKKYERFKNRLPQEARDINKLSVDELYNYVKDFSLEKTKASKEEKKQAASTYVHPGGDVVFRGDKWTVVKITDTGKLGKDAACFYGGNKLGSGKGETEWCTSSPGYNWFERYINKGPLYVVLPNNWSGKVGQTSSLPAQRYQFHFPDNQFMDVDDHQIDLVGFLNGEGSEMKEYFKPEFMKGVSNGANSEKVIIDNLKSGAVGKFIALYGLSEIFNSLPENITELQITNRDQEGLIIEVPESIGNFKNLKMILFDNCIDSIPDSICGLEKLRFIALMNNKNLTTVPECIKDLPNLFFLNLKGSTNVKVPPGILENSNDVGNLMFDFQDL
jgi:hypothetical protein